MQKYILDLNHSTFKIKKPIIYLVTFNDNMYYLEIREVGLYAYHKNLESAKNELIQDIIQLHKDLLEIPDEKLSEIPLSWKKYMQSHVTDSSIALNNCMESICDTFIDVEAHNSSLFKFLIDNQKKMKDPDNLSFFITEKLNNCIGEFVKETITDNEDVQIIFQNWSLFDQHTTKLCERLYGPAFSSDRSKHIINTYIQYKKTNILKEFNEKRMYWEPQSATTKQWINYISGIVQLTQGNTNEFVLALNEIIGTHINGKY